MEQAMVLSYTQLCLLASAQGFDGVVGLPDYKPLGGAEHLLHAVNSLVGSGLAEEKDGHYACTRVSAEIGRRIGEAQSYIAVHSNKRDLPDFSCYSGENELMICTPSLTRPQWVSVRYLTAAELCSLLEDEAYYPLAEETAEPEDEVLERYEAERLVDMDPNLPLGTDGDILFSAEKISRGGDSLGYIRVINYYFYRYISEAHDGHTKRTRFTPATLETALKGLVSGYDHS